uniref:Uncharacterized protein n=1 Tax=Anguilla anguilla TaxID=7936 RepID=A0A0E9W3Q2_ANGAN
MGMIVYSWIKDFLSVFRSSCWFLV